MYLLHGGRIGSNRLGGRVAWCKCLQIFLNVCLNNSYSKLSFFRHECKAVVSRGLLLETESNVLFAQAFYVQLAPFLYQWSPHPRKC